MGAVGALDGTLIRDVIPSDNQVPYQGRGRGECYQNVLGICDFDMVFTFIWAGWKGVAHDSRVLTETIRDPSNNFPFPPPGKKMLISSFFFFNDLIICCIFNLFITNAGKYYLCDAAYIHTRSFMAPYHNVQYWLLDFKIGRASCRERVCQYV